MGRGAAWSIPLRGLGRGSSHCSDRAQRISRMRSEVGRITRACRRTALRAAADAQAVMCNREWEEA